MEKRGIKVKDLIGLYPEAVFEKLSAETKVDYQVKKLDGKTMFLLLLMSVLDAQRLSLRVMEGIFKSQRFKVIASQDQQLTTRHSSIGTRLAQINASYFEKIFEKSVSVFRHYVKDTQVYRIERFDSTIVSLSSKLLGFGMVNGRKNKEGEHTINQIKFTIGFDGLMPVKAKMYTQQNHLSDDDPLYETIVESAYDKNSVITFDRGLKTRKYFKSMDESGRLFVTRINPTSAYKVLEQKSSMPYKADHLIIEQDMKVYLKSGAKKLVKTELRLIIAKAIKDDTLLYFVTNIQNFAAGEIAQIYRRRWDIEVFFRFLKQELHLKHIVSRTENGMKVMLFMTLITAMLILIYKKLNGLEGYKLVKSQFVEELDQEIMKFIIIACKGDPELLNSIHSFSGFGQ